MTIIEVRYSPKHRAVQWTGNNQAEIKSLTSFPVTQDGHALIVGGDPMWGISSVSLNLGDYFIVRDTWPTFQYSVPDLDDYPEV